MLYEEKANVFEMNRKAKKNFNKEVGNIKKKKMEILDLRYTIIKI